MAAQAGLCRTWPETPDRLSRVAAQMVSLFSCSFMIDLYFIIKDKKRLMRYGFRNEKMHRWVCDQAQHKPGCTTAKEEYGLETLNFGRKETVLS